MDATGPFPETKNGNKYNLVFKCALTKFVEIFALPELNGIEVARCYIDEIICRHGCPHHLITDRGTEFHNDFLKEVHRILFHTKHIKTTHYNPRSDGLVENQNRTLKDQLTAFTNHFGNNWDECLGIVAGAYRSTVNDATGFSPNEMVYGREVSQPCEAHIELSSEKDDLPNYVENLAKALRYKWEQTSNQIVDNVAIFNERPRAPLQFQPYKVGDYCMRKVRPKRYFQTKRGALKYKLSSKLQQRYVGPYRIIEVINPVLYVADVHGVPTMVHAVNLKRR